ncbi:MAG: AbgT family transporter [Firmicutes bacterium]|nr:AbgT family transporter [Bacillota bacterium]
MARRKKIKEKITLHPVMTFIVLIVIAIIISGVLSIFNVSVTYNALNSSKLDYVSTTESVNSLFNLSGIKYIFSNTVSNFANFTVLSHLIIVLIGIGVMEYSGFLKTAVGLLTKKAQKNVITYVIVLFCLLASIMDNLPFIAFIPLTALIFKYGKRNPCIGIIASFASLTCGHGLSLFFSSVDSSLAKLTTNAAHILDANFTFNTFALFLIMLVAIILMSFVITHITENYIARKLPKYEFEDDETLADDKISRGEIRGLLMAGLGSLAYLLIFIYNIIPGLPLSGNFLNYSETLYIDKLFGSNSFFANGFVFIVTILFIIWGLLYGIGAKTIKNNRDFVESIGYSLNGIGKTLVLIFAGATFISIFKQTNIGYIITAGLAKAIGESGFSGLSLVFLLFVVSAVSTLFVPGAVAKWAILSPTVVPAFINVGISGVFAQLVFRFGECVTLGLTPLFAYFIVYLAYLEKYNQNEKTTSLSSAIKYQAPYSACTAGILIALIVLWFLISLPLGVGGYVAV